MATWQAEIKVTNVGSFFPVTIESGAAYTAREAIEHIYRPISIRNLRQVSKKSSSSANSSEGSVEGTVALIGLVAAAWAFFAFTPWILMGLGGAAGTWIGEKVTSMSIEDYNERDDDSGHGKAAIILALALILGGVGFVKGSQIKADFDKPSTSTPVQVQKAK